MIRTTVRIIFVRIIWHLGLVLGLVFGLVPSSDLVL